MQQVVAKRGAPIATVSGMRPADYWRDVGAPKLRARKAEIGREMTNTTIAAAIEARSGKRTTRQLFEMFLKGKREPYVSQLVAICEVLKLDLSVLVGLPTVERQPFIRGSIRANSRAKNHTLMQKSLKP